MAELIGIYTGAGLNAPATNLIRIPTVAGTITGVYVDLSDVADGDTEFEITLDGVLVTGATIADGTEDESVTGLSTAMSLGSVIALNLVSPFPTSLPAPPITLIVTYTTATDIPYSHASSSSAAYLDFKEDSDNGSNRVRLIAPASTADVTVTLPAATDTLVGKDTTDTLTNKTIDANGTGNSITNLEVADFAASAIVTAADTISGNDNDTTIPTCAAVKDYADSVAGGSVATDAIFDAKGDLAVGTGANTAAKLSAGTDGQILSANSATSTGLEWIAAPSGSYSDEQAQDAVGGILTDSSEIDFTYNDATPSITASIVASSIDESKLDASVNASLDLADTSLQPGGALGTPSSGTLTNCSGLPQSGVTNLTTDLAAKAPKVNPQLALDASQASDDSYAGITINGRNAATGGLTQWDAVYINGSSEFALADANGTNTYPAVGLSVSTVSAAAEATVITHGVVRNDAWSWASIGQPIFLSTTAGGLTQTAPSTSGDKVQVIGIAISADEMLVSPQLTYITIT